MTLNAALDAMGGLDILINNPGAVRAGRLEEIDPDAIRTMIEVDLAEPIFLTRAALPELHRSGESLVVNVRSGIALVAQPFYSVYAAVKADIANFGEALRRELDEEGVGVLTVCPAATDAPMMDTSGMEPAGGYESSSDVAAAVIAAIERDEIRAIRGGKERRKMMVRAVEDPRSIDKENGRTNRRWKTPPRIIGALAAPRHRTCVRYRVRRSTSHQSRNPS